MFLLRLFGAPLVAGPEGPLAGRIAQRHPLALLALLATAPSATVSRDKLLGILWPDSDTDGARDLLNAAVHQVRKALGDAAVRSVGSSLQLDEALVHSDVRAFAEALCAGEPARAVEAYAGPFLDGFFLDAEEFDRWAEAERARLARLYAEALETLAGAAEAAGDPARAAGWWKRRAAHDPLDSRVALRLMESLAAAGDRAGALQHARVHEALLRQEFDAGPDAAITAFAERLRTAPPPATPPLRHAAEAAAADAAPREEPADQGHRPTPAAEAEAAPVVRAEPAPRRATPLRFPRSSPRRSAAGVLAAAAGVALFLGLPALRHRTAGGPAERGPARASVAVLPFADMSPGRDHEWLGDGLAEEIITALGEVPGIEVTARTSAFAFKGRNLDVRQIGDSLRVRYVVEGSVQKAESRLRVTARLVSVADGNPVWSGSYVRAPEEVFAVQDEVARGIVGELRPAQSGALAHGPRARPPTRDVEAYDLYLRARQAWNERTPEGLERALGLLAQAIARDSAFAEAYAGRAECYALLVGYGLLSPREGYPQARAAAEQALRLDASLARAHGALALVKLYFERDWRAAEREFLVAIRNNPADPTTRQWYATFLAFEGRFDEALAAVEQAQRLDPFSPAALTAHTTILYYARRYDAAIDQGHGALLVNSGFWSAHLWVAAAYAQQGRWAEALAASERAKRLARGHPAPDAVRGYVLAVSGRKAEARAVARALQERQRRQYLSPAYMAAIYTGLGEADTAIGWLGRAIEARDDWAIYLRVEPAFDTLRSDPRFAALLARTGPSP